MEIFCDLLTGIDDVAHVGIFGLAQRRGDADIDGVHRCGSGEISGGFQLAGLHQWSEHRSGDVLNIGLAAIERGNLFRINIDPRDRETGGGELNGQGQAYVAQANNAHVGGLRLDLLLKIIEITHLV